MEDKTTCPECGETARVEWRCVLESTDGPIEHAKVRCEHGHWFLLPVSMLCRRVEVPLGTISSLREDPVTT